MTVVFDFDGTIADTLETLLQIVNELADSFGYPKATPEQVEVYQKLSSRQILKQSGISYLQLPILIWKAQRLLSERMTTLQPFAEMERSLDELKAAGYQLGILTSNSQKNVELFLRTHDLSDRFDFIYSGLTVFGKERLFHQLLRQEAIDRDRLIYVGDETRDIEAAHRVGVKSIAVGWGFNAREALAKYNPDAEIDAPRELLSAVRSLSRAPRRGAVPASRSAAVTSRRGVKVVVNLLRQARSDARHFRQLLRRRLHDVVQRAEMR